MLELRSVGADDWRLWRELRLAALAESPAAFGSTLADWQGVGDREERWRERLSIPGAYDLVAFVDAEPAGMASGVPGDSSDTVELISMWVHPIARGRGVGGALVRAVADWATTRRASALELAVKADNAPAIAAYQRAGLTLVAGPDGVLVPDADNEVQMTMRLPAGSPLS